MDNTTLVDLDNLSDWLAANGLRLHSSGFVGENGSGDFVGLACLLPPVAPLAGLIGQGSREQQDEALVRRVANALLRAGRNVATGCAPGAEQAVIETVLDAGQAHRLRVFAAFGLYDERGGEDWQGLVATDIVRRAFDAGAYVHWWAGTPCTLNAHHKARLPMDERLADCKSALLRALIDAEKGSGLVVFAPEPGPWSPAITTTARQGTPVVTFGCHPPPLIDDAGSWVRAGTDGVWKSGWKWTG